MSARRAAEPVATACVELVRVEILVVGAVFDMRRMLSLIYADFVLRLWDAGRSMKSALRMQHG